MTEKSSSAHRAGKAPEGKRLATSLASLVRKQRAHFDSGATRSIDVRIRRLNHLKDLLEQHESEMLKALHADLRKPRHDAIIGELALVHRELTLAIRMLPRWSRKRRVRTNLVNFPSRSYLVPEPYGVAYIAGAWNFPVQLSLIPLVSALAAGNTVILKPSELAPHSSSAMAELINRNFPKELVHVVEGGAEVARTILGQKLDKIFFTGGSAIGRLVYEAAAKQLTPVTLELGGKNPAIVLPDCNIPVTARRLVWSKFFNAGQTCVAPDYVLVHHSVERALLAEMKLLLERHYNGQSGEENSTAIVNRRHFDRLRAMMTQKKIYFGGQSDTAGLFISPTILHNISFEDDVMQEEIFGPLLPVIRFADLESAMKDVRRHDRPLSLYVFGKKSPSSERLFNELSFGGGSLNDSVMYFVNHHLPYGGIGGSGLGAYHGFEGFRAFSHFKAIMEKGTWLEPWFLKVPPYTGWKTRVMRFLLERT